MTDDERLARLTELARRAFEGVDDLIVTEDIDVDFYKGSTDAFNDAQVLVRDDLRVKIESHPRALDALEAALLVLAGEPPAWVEQLASAWEAGAESRLVPEREAQWLRLCARELRERAKGEPCE